MIRILTCVLAVTVVATVAPAAVTGLLDDDGLEPTSLGASLAVVGDLDGDGVPDLAGDGVSELAVGSADAADRAGVVRVLSGATGAEILKIEGAEPADRLGSALVALDDLDGDGVADLVAAACPISDRQRDGFLLFLSGTDLSAMARWQPESNNTFAGVGLALLDDRDGDGLRDVLVGAATLRGADSFSGLLMARSRKDGSRLWSVRGARL
jgi:hypothetical protein